MAKTAKGLVAYAKAQLGKPYWYGTFGQAASKALYDRKKQQYPNYYKWEYAGETEKVHDCGGLIKGYLWCDDVQDDTPEYNKIQDISANDIKELCGFGKMENLPETPGVLLFYNGHMGVYIGSGQVIEARGRRYGVVKTKLAERPWKSWGYCPWITYEEPKHKMVHIELPVLKKGAKGDSVKAMQILLMGYGFDMEGYGADSSFGGATEQALKAFQKANGLEADGSCGPATWAKLLGV